MTMEKLAQSPARNSKTVTLAEEGGVPRWREDKTMGTPFQHRKVLGSGKHDSFGANFGHGVSAPPGSSPTSPRSVMALADTSGTSDDFISGRKPPSFPVSGQYQTYEPTTKMTDATVKTQPKLCNNGESTAIARPYHGRYLLTPSNHVLEPILRTILDAKGGNRGGPDVATIIIDDVLEHQLHLHKSGNHIFSGNPPPFRSGPRLVLVRHVPISTSSYSRMSTGMSAVLEFKQEFDVYCSEKTTADAFLRYLQTHDVEVEEAGSPYR